MKSKTFISVVTPCDRKRTTLQWLCRLFEEKCIPTRNRKHSLDLFENGCNAQSRQKFDFVVAQNSTRLINPAKPAETGHKSNGTARVILCTHTRTQAYTALGQEDSASSEPAVTCRSRCSGKLLLTATIDDLIKLSPRRCAAAGAGEGRRCGDGDGGGGRLSASGGKYPGGLVHAYH